jgi:hypothetical protein
VVRISASAPVKPISWTLFSIVFLHLPPGEAPAARGPRRDHVTCKDGEKGRAKARAGRKPACTQEGRRVRLARPRSGSALTRPDPS